MDQKKKTEDDARNILLGITFSLLLSPITFHLAQAGSFKSDIFACILAILPGIFVYILLTNLKQRCQQLQQTSNQGFGPKTLFHIISSSLSSPSADKTTDSHGGEKQSENHLRRKINPKYFKPKYIIHELMSMWGTTYTVITWGSVWVVGGTIVATEKLAQKIKTRYGHRDHQERGLNNDTSRCTGRNNSFNSSKSSSFSDSTASTQGTNRTTLRRITSWTRKSCASARKKFNKFIGSGVPQITTGSMVHLNNDS